MIISQKIDEVLSEREKCNTGSYYANKLMAVFNSDEPAELDQFCQGYGSVCDEITELEGRLKELKAERSLIESVLKDRLLYDTKTRVRGHEFEIFMHKSAKPSVECKVEASKAHYIAFPKFVEQKFSWRKSEILKPLMDEHDYLHNDATDIAKIVFKEKLRIRNLADIKRIWEAK